MASLSGVCRRLPLFLPAASVSKKELPELGSNISQRSTGLGVVVVYVADACQS